MLVINGDLGELDRKQRSAQIITQNKSTILEMVRDVLEVTSWDSIYIVRGTPAHTGRSSWLEEEVGKDLGAVTSDTDVHSWWHIRATVEGVRLDIANHGSMGKKPWTRSNSANSLASETFWNYKVERDAQPPDVVIRSHNHIFSEGKTLDTRVYFTPCWSGITEYGYRIGHENTLPSIGGMVLFCEDGKFTPKVYTYTADKEKRVWSMKL